MLTAAALVPDTALLVPGAAGVMDALVAERAAAVAAAQTLVAAERIIAVVAGLQTDPPGRPSLAAAGVDDRFLGWPASGPGAAGNVAASVGLLLLSRSGWTGNTEVISIRTADGARAVGADLVGSPDQVGLLLLGTMSARRQSGAPLPPDPRAVAVDDAVLADLAELDSHAVDRLAAVPAGLADDLAMTAWAPWQVLVGAVRAGRSPASSTVHHVATGPVRYAAVSWRW